MASRQQMVKSNVSGDWYVDCECIDCDLCRTTAPANFRANEEDGHSYVYKQPETEEELRLCEQAMVECPVEAIGSDGVEASERPHGEVSRSA